MRTRWAAAAPSCASGCSTCSIAAMPPAATWTTTLRAIWCRNSCRRRRGPCWPNCAWGGRDRGVLPDTLHIGPVPIHWFGIFLALALVAAGWAAGREFGRQGFDRSLAWDAVLWAALGGIIGARLWMVFETWPAF